MSEQNQFESALQKVNKTYFPAIERQLTNNGIEMNEYSKECVTNALSAINNVLDTQGVSWNDSQLDHSNVTQTLLQVASLQLNPSAHPNEVFFQIRNVKRKKRDEQGKFIEYWKKQIEMGIEGDGNDAILSRFGRGVKEVRQHWLVRENDEFEYPRFAGLDMDPPKWSPRGSGKVVRVVYPIIKQGGAVEFHIGEREDVIKNLLAHISNNLMWETFGIDKNKKAQIKEKKQEIYDRVKELGLDGALADKEIQKYVSPAWKNDQSKESMIIRKIRNNIVKKIPKDFGHTLAELHYDESSSDSTEQTRKEVNEHANSEFIDITPNEPQNEPEPSQEDQSTEADVQVEEEEKPSQEAEEEPKKKTVDQEEIKPMTDDDVPF